MAFKKVVRIGMLDVPYESGNIFCKIELSDEGRLSISGVIGPMVNDNARGGCGQIDGGFAHCNPEHNDARTTNPYKPEDIKFAPGWDADKLYDFLEVWKKWHLNDLQAGCEHQRAEGWDKRPIDPSKPTTAYGKHFEGQLGDSWNMLTWISRKEHPQGLLSHPCSTCGYKYGTAWLKVEVPQDAIDFLKSLPDTDQKPAWV